MMMYIYIGCCRFRGLKVCPWSDEFGIKHSSFLVTGTLVRFMAVVLAERAAFFFGGMGAENMPCR